MKMLTCREAEKMVMPYIEDRLSEEELEAFLRHVNSCRGCREELEIYYTVLHGLRQLDDETGDYDMNQALEESLDLSWLRVRAGRLRKIICYAVDTLGATGVLTVLVMQIRMWLQAGI
jgi:hypothetical protein